MLGLLLLRLVGDWRFLCRCFEERIDCFYGLSSYYQKLLAYKHNHNIGINHSR